MTGECPTMKRTCTVLRAKPREDFFDEEADRMQQLVDGRGAVWHANVQAQNDCCTLELIVAMTT